METVRETERGKRERREEGGRGRKEPTVEDDMDRP